MKNLKNRKVCDHGHLFYKTSDCPICPTCEAQRKPTDNFLALFSAPARRALENNGITTLTQLSHFTEEEVKNFHGMGKSTIEKLQKLLTDSHLKFK